MEGIVEFLDEQERNDKMRELLSECAKSNIYTMGIAAELDPRQALPDKPCIPPKEVRVLRARLILEEALETIEGLGCFVNIENNPRVEHRVIFPGDLHDGSVFISSPSETPEREIHNISSNAVDVYDRILDGIIDGCCDTIYVCVGTLLACGVPDVPHILEVCNRNNAKLPNGKGVADANGKFQKPEGWTSPNHMDVIAATPPLNLADVFQSLKAIEEAKST